MFEESIILKINSRSWLSLVGAWVHYQMFGEFNVKLNQNFEFSRKERQDEKTKILCNIDKRRAVFT